VLLRRRRFEFHVVPGEKAQVPAALKGDDPDRTFLGYRPGLGDHLLLLGVGPRRVEDLQSLLERHVEYPYEGRDGLPRPGGGLDDDGPLLLYGRADRVDNDKLAVPRGIRK